MRRRSAGRVATCVRRVVSLESVTNPSGDGASGRAAWARWILEEVSTDAKDSEGRLRRQEDALSAVPFGDGVVVTFGFVVVTFGFQLRGEEEEVEAAEEATLVSLGVRGIVKLAAGGFLWRPASARAAAVAASDIVLSNSLGELANYQCTARNDKSVRD
ncbi:hypothetical protein CYMTET_15783 [Cymbomonas tetramitiformis]|uniref:Uncharacterized protein n=1 Tax=Cymbomonas tetramitiformis TaxID=36881 RepID=A0AAE0L8Y4_9CHLO|nr:hypothetical protein CYMTET_15783 [Cymbomonas tetramitiformis]